MHFLPTVFSERYITITLTGTQSKISTIIFLIFREFLMFFEIFLSPQVKKCAIITYKHGICELPHELPNDLILRILGN